tara:strand:- start:172 stop:1182 length:1011 start_codon:yes stop_codon:yes gene_type:complete
MTILKELSNMRIAIIGGAGFVGTRLVSRMKMSNFEYSIFDINSSKLLENITHLNVEDPKSLENIKGANSIINLAAVHRDDVLPLSRYDDVNVQGAVNVCEAARKYGIDKIVFTSSVAIYGFAPPETNESGEPNYFNDYGRTKYLAEQIYKEWQAEDSENRTLVIVRPTVIFGEGNRGNVYNLLKQIASGRFVMIGNGKNKKSMAYVENVSAFIEHSLSFKPGLHIYNYIDKPDFDMNELVIKVRKTLFDKNNVGPKLPSFLGKIIGYFADLFAKLTGKTLPVSSIRIKKFMSTTQFASSMNNIDFVPPVSLEEGLARTLRYEFLEDNSGKQIFETE